MTEPTSVLHNHYSAPLSDRDKEMMEYVPPGGNWQDIPEDFPSDRISQIYESYRAGKGSRSTYYGRLDPEEPSYTISTYFNRPGNGCNVHPNVTRAMSIREAARFQSFPDTFVFENTQTSKHNQVGNAVPPLLARAIGEHLSGDTFVDLFAGAGGLSLGLEMAGFDCVLAAEKEEYICDTHRRNLPNTRAEELDLSEPDAPSTIVSILEEMDVLDDVDLVVGGPPCQGYSHANERNPDDPRNALVQHFQDCIEEIGPDGFLMENVTGLKTIKNGDLFDKVKQEFRDLGFNIEWNTLRAEEFGVPQKRRRIFVAGTANTKSDLLPAEPLFSDSDATKPPVITVGDAIGDLPDETVDEMDVTTEYASDPQHPYQKYVRGVYGFEDMYDELCEMANTMDQKRLGSY